MELFLIYTTIWTNFTNIILREQSQTETYSVISYEHKYSNFVRKGFYKHKHSQNLYNYSFVVSEFYSQKFYL